MINILLSLLGKSASIFSSTFNLGAGSTWPGHIALRFNKNFIKETIGSKTKIVLVAGTNGKTTTSAMVTHILSSKGFKVLQNNSGANLLNGAASTIVKGLPLFSSKLSADFLILEVDENNLPMIISQTNPSYIICLNLFRDQLDRYGEIDSIIKKWKSSFEKLTNQTTVILNSDDPQISYLGENLKTKVLYFGLTESHQEKLEHGADSIYCPKCFSNLDYKSIVFSHLGNWSCSNCGLKRQTPNINSFEPYPLPGTYNKYNTLAAVLFARQQNLKDDDVEKGLKSFKPAFGRQEEFKVNGKIVKIFLSKNPTSFNQSLSTISDLKAKNILIVLNDRIPDGLDVSWIWDTNLSDLSRIKNITISGERCYDMGLRVKYEGPQEFQISNFKFQIEENLKKATNLALSKTPKDQILYILPTYSAMLEVRKILKGRAIL